MAAIRFGVFEIDLSASELRKEGSAVKLPPQPFRVLTELAQRKGELVPREELKQILWGDGTHVEHDRGINFCMNQIRGALGDDSENPRYVQTVPKRGYRFIAPVEVVGIQLPRRKWIAAAIAG